MQIDHLRLRISIRNFAVRFWPCFLVVFASANASTVHWPPPEPVQQRLAAAIDLAEQIEATLPSPINDVADLANQLNYDFEAAVEYVRQEVRYEPYVGVLKGPDGAAVTGSGNAWDQALLLAALLKTMGAYSQIVAGEISDQMAQELVSNAFLTNPTTNETFNGDSLVSSVAGYDEPFAQALEMKIEEWASVSASDLLEDDVTGISDALRSLLEKANVQIRDPDGIAVLINALSTDYAWVQWRSGPSKEWKDVHPAFPSDIMPEPQTQRVLADTVPPEYQHRVALQLWIERSGMAGGNDIERVPVMDRFERPTAQLFKNQLSLGMGPLGAETDKAQSFIVPILNQSIAPGGKAVTAQGITVDAGDAGSAGAELFATLAGRVGDALGALNTQADGEPAGPRLTAVVLTAEISVPGRDTRTVERRLVDLRQSTDVAFPDAAIFDLVLDVDVGAENRARVANRSVKQQKALLQAMPVFYALARGALTFEQMQRTEQFKQLDQAGWLDIDLLSGRFLDTQNPNSFVFRHGPMLTSRRTFVDPESGLVSAIDFLSNPSTVLSRQQNGDVILDRGGALRQGVRDTVLESYLVPTKRPWSERLPESIVLDAASFESNNRVSGWPVAAREMAKQDIADGFVLALAQDVQPHWWRVHLETGETLGMGQLGGQTVTEYVVMVTSAVLSAWLFKNSVESCDEQYPNNQGMADCCIVGNLIATYGTAGLGGAISLPSVPAQAFSYYPLTTAAGYIFLALSYETSVNVAAGAVGGGVVDAICASYVDN